MSDLRQGISFGGNVDPGSTSREKYRVTEDSTIESVSVRIYPGPENALRIRPLVIPESDNGTTEYPIPRFRGKDYLDGDNDVWEFDVSVPISKDDKIVIEADNTDPDNVYSYRANVDVDELGGSQRIARMIGGVL